MHIAEVAIRRWQLTLVLFALLCALGFSAFQNVPRAVDPHFSMPVVSIVALQPGADAAEVEQTITKPIEELLPKALRTSRMSPRRAATAMRSFESNSTGLARIRINISTMQCAKLPRYVVRLPNRFAKRLTFEKIRTTNTSILQIALLSDTASWYQDGEICARYQRSIGPL